MSLGGLLNITIVIMWMVPMEQVRVMDHQMILSKDDPILKLLLDLNEPVYVMDENPTAENIAKRIHEEAQNAGLDIMETRLWETPSSYASYTSSESGS